MTIITIFVKHKGVSNIMINRLAISHQNRCITQLWSVQLKCILISDSMGCLFDWFDSLRPINNLSGLPGLNQY